MTSPPEQPVALNLTPELCEKLALRGLIVVPDSMVELPLVYQAPVRLFNGVELHGLVIGAYSYVSPDAVLRNAPVPIPFEVSGPFRSLV